MHPLLVDYQSRSGLEAAPAHVALVRPLSRVLHLVRGERLLALELLLAVAALELRLKVLGHVLLQVVGSPRLELAELALQRVVHRVSVVPHLVVTREDFGADCAGGRLGKVNVPLVEGQAFLAGGNCMKIGLPGKSILGDYFQENSISEDLSS